MTPLPPESTPAERFDGTFFLDFPGREQKQAIWNIYLDLFEIDRDQKLPPDDSWTGAEIRACCRLAALLDVPLVQAAQNVVPVAMTAAKSVERMRDLGQRPVPGCRSAWNLPARGSDYQLAPQSRPRRVQELMSWRNSPVQPPNRKKGPTLSKLRRGR